MFGLGKKASERKKQRQEKKQSRRQFKLAKKAQRAANKQSRRDSRTDRVQARQDGRSDRVNTRQTARTAIHQSRDEADMVAYENHMTPINRAAGIIGASADAAQGVASVIGSLSGAGVFGEGVAALNTSQPGVNRNIDFNEDGDVSGISEDGSSFPQAAVKTSSNFMLMVVAVLAAIVLLFTGKKRKK